MAAPLTHCPRCARDVALTAYGRCCICGLELVQQAPRTSVPFLYHRPWLRLGIFVAGGLSLVAVGLLGRAFYIGVDPNWNVLWLPVTGVAFLFGAWVRA